MITKVTETTRLMWLKHIDTFVGVDSPLIPLLTKTDSKHFARYEELLHHIQEVMNATVNDKFYEIIQKETNNGLST